MAILRTQMNSKEYVVGSAAQRAQEYRLSKKRTIGRDTKKVLRIRRIYNKGLESPKRVRVAVPSPR
ncbi:MAG TPA: hypothetical protein VJQ25_06590 [Nitrospira sp.]|nr:hypothetical protein [Nitrospira sp.]